MPKNTPDPSNCNPEGKDHTQAALQWMQQQLAEQGIIATPEEARELFEQRIIYDVSLDIQQDLAAHGIDVSPDEAVSLSRLHFCHNLMKRFGTTAMHEAP